ncbi:MAG: HEAT repeat domain-containing protein [Cyclobacteriaceae bacterium]
MRPQQLITILLAGSVVLLSVQCTQSPSESTLPAKHIADAARMAAIIEPTVSASVDSNLTLRLWAVDSLVADPVSIDIDDVGQLYYTRTNRQKHAEFDIRGHQDWEIESIRLQSIEEKREFLHRALAPEKSGKNQWLSDLNGDGSHDWKDMTVERENIYQLRDTDGDGLADESRLLVSDFHEEVTDAAGGILRHGNDLFVGIGPDLWRYQFDDQFVRQKTSISHGYGIHIGFSGHGMSGIEVGPEGKIYWQIGDIGFSGKDQTGKLWHHPFSGVIVRSNPDGSDFEVFSYGNRNTHEFTFDEYGNLISEDNDGDHAGESERLVYVVNGADIGWRTHWQFGKYHDPQNNGYNVWMDEKLYIPRFDGQAAYIVPTIRNFVNGPTGFVYNPGTALGDQWKNHFFVAEFVGNPTRSGIHAFTLKPEGAGFAFGSSSMIVSGVLATGLDFGPDGALYAGDWIDGWGTKNYGRIWKIDSKTPATLRTQVKQYLAEDFSKKTIEDLAGLLRHEDMRVRQKSQFELAARGDSGAEALANALQSKHQLERIHGIWGLRQMAGKQPALGEKLVPLLSDADPEIRAQAAKWLGDMRFKGASATLRSMLKDPYARARFFAAEALGRTADATATEGLIELLRENDDQDVYLRHAAALALARIGNAGKLVSLVSDPSRAVRLGAVVALRRMQHEGIKEFLKDKEERVVVEAARAINDDESIAGAMESLGAALLESKFTSEALIRRAINANLRLGTTASMDRLIQYAGRESAPVALRQEAIDALSTWSRPSVTDRVDGRYRGEIKRDPAEVQQKALEPFRKLLLQANASLRLSAVRALGRLEIKAAIPELTRSLGTDKHPAVRSEAMHALVRLKAANEQAFASALQDSDKGVRIVALELLSQSGLTADAMAKLLGDVIDTKTIEERQTALLTLGTIRSSQVATTLGKLIGQMEQRQLPQELLLELGEALDSARIPALLEKYKSLAGALSTDTLKASYASSLLGGNPQRGAQIFWGHASAQCVRCHSLGDYGGTAGPRLNGVASRLTREQLLEALINPSARIAAGYGTVSLELTDGKTINGVLMAEKADGLHVKSGDLPEVTIPRSQIRKRTDGASSMPPMRFILTRKEIRDVVSYLSELKK